MRRVIKYPISADKRRVNRKPPVYNDYDEVINSVNSGNVSSMLTFDLVTTMPRVIRVLLEAYIRDSSSQVEDDDLLIFEICGIIQELKNLEDEEIPVNRECLFVRLAQVLPRLWY